jgi:hypothetical protein
MMEVRRLRRGARLIGLVGAILARTSAADAEWFALVEGGLVYETNLSRASRSEDRKSDLALVPTLIAGHAFQISDSTRVLVFGDLRGSIYTDFDRLNNLWSGLGVSGKHKFGLGAAAPWVRVFGSGAYLNYREDVRDSTVVDAGVEGGKRIHERVDLLAGYRYETRDADNRVFDGESHTISLRGNASITHALELSLGYAVQWGDLVVHRSPLGPSWGAPGLIVDTFDTPLEAVRIDATTHILSADLGFQLTPHAAVIAGYEYQISHGPEFDYPNHVVRTRFSYSF